MSTYLHTRLAAATQLANREVLQVTVSKDEFLKLRGRTANTGNIQRRHITQHFKPE